MAVVSSNLYTGTNVGNTRFTWVMVRSHDYPTTKVDTPDSAKYYALNLLAPVLAEFEYVIGANILFTCWYRSPAHNKSVGGAHYSIHLTGAAADIYCSSINSKKLFQLAMDFANPITGKRYFSGIGYYPNSNFIHVDVRDLLYPGALWISDINGKVSAANGTGQLLAQKEYDESGEISKVATLGSASLALPKPWYSPNGDTATSKSILLNVNKTIGEISNAVNTTAATIVSLNPKIFPPKSPSIIYNASSVVKSGSVIIISQKTATAAITTASDLKLQAATNVKYSAYKNTDKNNFLTYTKKTLATKAVKATEVATKTSALNDKFSKGKINDTMEYPISYERAYFSILNVANNTTRKIEFILGVESQGEGRSNAINAQKTMGGWFISRHGENIINISLNGRLLDTRNVQEKQSLIEDYKANIVDRLVENEYMNDNLVTLTLEGRKYFGDIVSLSIQKNAQSRLTASYAISFMGVEDSSQDSSVFSDASYSSATGKVQIAINKILAITQQLNKTTKGADRTKLIASLLALQDDANAGVFDSRSNTFSNIEYGYQLTDSITNTLSSK